MFKEIELSEKQGTGITKILRELEKNGSPAPEYEMDDDRTYLAVTIRRRERFEPERMSDKMSDKEERFYRIMMEKLNAEGSVTTRSMVEASGMASSTARRYLAEFCEQGIIIQNGKNRNARYQRA